jgi:hypothetical protein
MIIKRKNEEFTEQFREQMQTEIYRDRKLTRAELHSIYGKNVWTPEELCKKFAVVGFAPPLAIAQRISDLEHGTVYYQGQPPEFYFGEFLGLDGEPK